MVEVLLVLAVAAPLVAAGLTAVLGPRILRERSHIPAVAGVAVAFLASALLAGWWFITAPAGGSEAAQQFTLDPAAGPLIPHLGREMLVTLWTWTKVDEALQAPSLPGSASPVVRPFDISITLRVDALTLFMLVTVTSVSLLVVIYSIGYMAGDPGYWRFFAYISLFVFSMMMLVSVSNFLLLYVFWEAVGLCSYLLIGFWYSRPAAAAAGKKAFLVNRVGDFGFALGVFLLWITYGTLNMHDTPAVPGILGEMRLVSGPQGFVGGSLGIAICLLLFLGACGKSAQFPLHVWLPDAMEGPTPVSALIHAATMVTAGVYLVVRCAPLFQVAPEAQLVVTCIGTFTALLAALIALTQTDLKRILAYSTISQLGYMFAAAGLSTTLAVAAAMFHLFTHAFFKALLFLSAGSVMHATGGEIDIRRLGGLGRKLPVTQAMFLIGALALAGVFPLAGFWSKDSILHEIALQVGQMPLAEIVFWGLLVGAFLTAFYIFRAYFLAFFGPEKLPEVAISAHSSAHEFSGQGHAVHESPPVMLVPMILLACGAVAAGWIYFLPGGVVGLLESTPSLAGGLGGPAVEVGGDQEAHSSGGSALQSAEKLAQQVPWLGSAAAIGGILLAAILYLPFGRGLVEQLTKITKAAGLYTISYGKFFFDEVYELLIVRPLRGLSEWCYAVDQRGIDQSAVDGTGEAVLTAGRMVRGLGHGMLSGYALLMIAAVVIFLGLWLL
ncbi:MAG: NADH-quinone oxidoreductase subunit L [Thermoguttaceae bacterium]|nr:NADH-quinone oxidoreductase subunit L [Thermoguttaceae bacterium]MDW8079610.1 NADH-quinone oxidoreductase subunit L [Thermoguttaceae bacterium]